MVVPCFPYGLSFLVTRICFSFWAIKLSTLRGHRPKKVSQLKSVDFALETMKHSNHRELFVYYAMLIELLRITLT